MIPTLSINMHSKELFLFAALVRQLEPHHLQLYLLLVSLTQLGSVGLDSRYHQSILSINFVSLFIVVP